MKRALRGPLLACLAACGSSPPTGNVATSSADTDAVAVAPPAVRRLPGGQLAAVSIALHRFSKCVLVEDHTVWCWYRPDELKQIPLADVAQIEASDERTYARTSSGEVYFWGREGKAESQVPVRMKIDPAREIAVGPTKACARLEHDVACWDTDPRTPKPLGVDAVAISTGLSETCAATTTDIKCWNDKGKLRVRPARNVVQLAATQSMTCSRSAGGRVECWGDSAGVAEAHQLFRGTFSSLHSGPFQICGVSTGGTAACATDGESWRPPPPPGPALAFVKAPSDVAMADSYGCFIDQGVVSCWGDTSRTLDVDTVPVAMPLGDLASLRAVLDVAPVRDRTCIVGMDHKARCWGGYNFGGDLGVGKKGEVLGPTVVPGIDDAVAVGMTESSMCIVRSGGALLCTNVVEECSLDKDKPPCRMLPTGLTGAKNIEMAASHSCTLDLDGGVRCWGQNEWGQLGTGDLVDSKTAKPVLGTDKQPIKHIAKLEVFEEHSCAIDESGALYCWGRNLSLDQPRPYSSPVRLKLATRVPTDKPVAAIQENCLLQTDGEIRCWDRGFDDAIRYGTARLGLCGVSKDSGLVGGCASKDGALACLGEKDVPREPLGAIAGGDSWSAPEGRKVCVIDEHHALHCWGANHSIGVRRPKSLSPSAACPTDPIPAPPRWPPENFTEALVDHGAGKTRKLRADEVKVLVNGLNDEKNWGDFGTGCGSMSVFKIVFRNADHEDVAWIEREGDCALWPWPPVPVARDHGDFIGTAAITLYTRIQDEPRH